MTRSPDDQIDPYEPRLTRRVDEFAEQAVRPFDAAAIAAAAHAGARRGTLAGRVFGSNASMARLGLVLTGALVAIAAFGTFIDGGGHPVLGPDASIAGPIQTPTAVPNAVDACAAQDLVAVITAWEGAAGHRIATIDIHNGGSTDCRMPRHLRPALIDGSGRALIVGDLVPEPAPMTFPADSSATTMVDMANYCGTAPADPLKIRLSLDDRTSIEAAAGNLPNPPDAPPCSGPSARPEIQMQELKLK